MTALKQYARLESDGLWRASPEVQRRDVAVSFGKTTLVISDNANRPLAHWSLAAIRRLDDGPDGEVYFSPDKEGGETLALRDPVMIEAIGAVRSAILARSGPTTSKRGRGRWLLLAGMAGLLVAWLPAAMHDQTLAVVPPAKRGEIGATILGHMQSRVGPSCRSQQGRRALDNFSKRLFGEAGDLQIVVLPLEDERGMALPGGIIVLPQKLIERTDDPTLPAGYAIALQADILARDPLAPVLSAGGMVPTFTLLTTGDLPPELLETYAASLVVEGALPVAPDDLLKSLFSQAEVSPAAFVAQTGRAMALGSDIGANAATGRMVISDSDWVALQGICDR